MTVLDDENDLLLWRIALYPSLLKESSNLYNDFKELKQLRHAVEDVPVESR